MARLGGRVGAAPVVTHPRSPHAVPAQIFVRLREWLATATALADRKLATAFALEGREREVAAWEARLSPLCLPESFCHNDLQCGNVLVTHAPGAPLRRLTRPGGEGACGCVGVCGQGRDRWPATRGTPSDRRCTGVADSGEPKQAFLIDFEYAHRAYSAFDIADHLVEWGYDYDGDAPHVCHRDMLPSTSERRAFIAAYLGRDASDRACFWQSAAPRRIGAPIALSHSLPTQRPLGSGICRCRRQFHWPTCYGAYGPACRCVRAWGPTDCPTPSFTHTAPARHAPPQAATSSVDFDFVAYGTHRLDLVELHREEAEHACAALGAARGLEGAEASSSPSLQAQ